MRALVGIAAACAALACGCGDEPPAGEAPAEATKATATPRDPPPLPERTRERGFVGVVFAREAADVSARFAGRVADVHVSLGDEVEAGEPLATLDREPIREELRVAQAALAAAQAEVRAAEVEVEASKENLVVERRGHAAGTTSQKDLVAAEFRLRRARAAKTTAEATVAEHRAVVAQLQKRVADAAVTAPFTGTVSLRYLDPGAVVAAGDPLVRIITSGELWVRFAVPAEAAAAVREGDVVDLDISVLGVRVPATVENVAPELDPTSQMIFVEAMVDVPEELRGRLQAGLVARVHPR